MPTLPRRKAPLHPEHFDHAGAASADTAEVVIDHPGPQDAPGVAACFRTVYGDGYLHPDVYDPARYLADIASGELVTVVARSQRRRRSAGDRGAGEERAAIECRQGRI